MNLFRDCMFRHKGHVWYEYLLIFMGCLLIGLIICSRWTTGRRRNLRHRRESWVYLTDSTMNIVLSLYVIIFLPDKLVNLVLTVCLTSCYVLPLRVNDGRLWLALNEWLCSWRNWKTAQNIFDKRTTTIKITQKRKAAKIIIKNLNPQPWIRQQW